MIKIILYFVIFSFIYNIWKNLKINYNRSKTSPSYKTNKKSNFTNNSDDILDAEYEDI
tara:strand:- start:982 stop:1155 length:174 start_codon:yes stop_codon:yes gene_type:complete